MMLASLTSSSNHSPGLSRHSSTFIVTHLHGTHLFSYVHWAYGTWGWDNGLDTTPVYIGQFISGL
jgi:hypothetical protein